MKTFYTTPEHHIELMQVKEYNRRQTAWHMKFFTEQHHVERTRGWVVDVAYKNGVGTRQRYCQNYREGVAFIEMNYLNN